MTSISLTQPIKTCCSGVEQWLTSLCPMPQGVLPGERKRAGRFWDPCRCAGTRSSSAQCSAFSLQEGQESGAVCSLQRRTKLLKEVLLCIQNGYFLQRSWALASLYSIRIETLIRQASTCASHPAPLIPFSCLTLDVERWPGKLQCLCIRLPSPYDTCDTWAGIRPALVFPTIVSCSLKDLDLTWKLPLIQ